MSGAQIDVLIFIAFSNCPVDPQLCHQWAGVLTGGGHWGGGGSQHSDTCVVEVHDVLVDRGAMALHCANFARTHHLATQCSAVVR